MASHHTHFESRRIQPNSNPIHPTLEFDLNDHILHVSPLVNIPPCVGVWHSSTFSYQSRKKMTRMIPRASSSISYSFKDAFFERVAKMEEIEQEVAKLQWASLMRPHNLKKSKQVSWEPWTHYNLYRPNSIYEQPTPTTPIQEPT